MPENVKNSEEKKIDNSDSTKTVTITGFSFSSSKLDNVYSLFSFAKIFNFFTLVY